MFRLAAMLGCTVRELGARMGADELGEWLAFDREYTWPDPYFTTAMVGRSVFAAVGGKAPPAGEIVPYFARPPREQTPTEQRAILHALKSAARSRAGRV